MKIKAIDRGNGNILGEWELSGTRVGTGQTPDAAEALVRSLLPPEEREHLHHFETRWDRGRQAWVVWVVFYPAYRREVRA